MNEQKGQVKISNVLKFAGSIIAFLIGAGFATGQEILQYFTSEGWFGLGGIAIGFAGFIFVFVAMMETGFITKKAHSLEVFQYYTGKHIGILYEIFTGVLMFLIFSSMIAGAGAIFAQSLGIPEMAGRIIVLVVVAISVLQGFERILDILGPLGPVIIFGCILVALAAIANNPAGIAKAPEFVESHDMLKMSNSWWLSGILYGFNMVYPIASFGTALGAVSTSKREIRLTALLGVGLFAVGAALTQLGQMAHIEQIYNAQIPTLALAEIAFPIMSKVFSIILILGIYTTVTPFLFALSEKVAPLDSTRFKVATGVFSIGAFGISFFSYARLINILYPLAGYLSFLLIGAMVFKHVKLTLEERKGDA